MRRHVVMVTAATRRSDRFRDRRTALTRYRKIQLPTLGTDWRSTIKQMWLHSVFMESFGHKCIGLATQRQR